jgi:hypothetical protein
MGVSASAHSFGILRCGLEVPADNGQADQDADNKPDDYQPIHESIPQAETSSRLGWAGDPKPDPCNAGFDAFIGRLC